MIIARLVNTRTINIARNLFRQCRSLPQYQSIVHNQPHNVRIIIRPDLVRKLQTQASAGTSIRKDNYFMLFNVPLTFDIDVDKLSSNYKQLQSLHHPDKLHHLNQNAQPRTISSANINAAYETLLNPHKRSAYLLSLLSPACHQAQQPSTAFLAWVMEFRETMQTIQSKQELKGLHDEFNKVYMDCLLQTKLCFEKCDWDHASINSIRLQYFWSIKQQFQKLHVAFDVY